MLGKTMAGGDSRTISRQGWWQEGRLVAILGFCVIVTPPLLFLNYNHTRRAPPLQKRRQRRGGGMFRRKKRLVDWWVEVAEWVGGNSIKLDCSLLSSLLFSYLAG